MVLNFLESLEQAPPSPGDQFVDFCRGLDGQIAGYMATDEVDPNTIALREAFGIYSPIPRGQVYTFRLSDAYSAFSEYEALAPEEKQAGMESLQDVIPGVEDLTVAEVEQAASTMVTDLAQMMNTGTEDVLVAVSHQDDGEFSEFRDKINQMALKLGGIALVPDELSWVQRFHVENMNVFGHLHYFAEYIRFNKK